jgi:hypothetical protein
MTNSTDRTSRTAASPDAPGQEADKAGLFFQKTIRISILAMLAIFIAATSLFVLQNSHFLRDDIDHFLCILKLPLRHYLLMPIDVHFAPLHKLASLIIFKLSPLDFRVALGFMAAVWIATIFLTYRILIRLTSNQAAWLILLFFGTSPLWIHNLIWWSSAAHRLPYLLLQTAAILAYLRYREKENRRDAIICVVMQILTFGFYVKAMLFPVILAALEICLAFREDRVISKAGIKLCAAMAVISIVYVSWYFLFSPVMRPSHTNILFENIPILSLLLSYLGSMLLFAPIDQPWSAWASGAFWCGLAFFSIWRRPGSILPITALLLMLSLDFAMIVFGRDLLNPFSLTLYPFEALRYFLDQAVIMVLFIALIAGQNTAGASRGFAGGKCAIYALSIIFMIIYPLASYQTNRILFSSAHQNYRQAHIFMTNIKQSLQEQANGGVIAGTRFPAFATTTISNVLLEDIFGPLYPKIKWVNAEKFDKRLLYVRNDGSIVPGKQCEQSECTGWAKDTELFIHKSPYFTVTVPKHWEKCDDLSIPNVILHKTKGFLSNRLVITVKDIGKYSSSEELKNVLKLYCFSIPKMFKFNITSCHTLYEREIRLKDDTPAYEHEVTWETPKIPQLVFHVYRVIAVKDKKIITIEAHSSKPISADLKEFPLSLHLNEQVNNY